MPEQEFKRHIAFKMRIGDLLSGKPVIDMDRFKCLELEGKQIVRVNLIANITDKFVQEGEKKFASVTLDDASGQIKLKLFGDDINKFTPFAQGDTVVVIGLLRVWNNELYVTPEIIKKRDPSYLLVRKLEVDKEKPKVLEKSELAKIRDQVLESIKAHDEQGGVDVEQMMLDLKATPESINAEIRKLLEEGMVYEPRPGKLRYLG
jgi:RecG-like helicase